jgi:hypothetical protein
MISEEGLENLFQNGVALVAQGASPVTAAQALKLNGATSEIVPLLELVEVASDLPRYRMPPAAQAALLARLTGQVLDRPAPPPAWQTPANLGQATRQPGRPQLRWKRFLRLQQAVAVIALALALGLIIVWSFQANSPDFPPPAYPAATAGPTLPLSVQPGLSPEPRVTPTLTLPATVTPIAQTTPLPGLTNPVVPTTRSADRLEPTIGKVDSTQAGQSGIRQPSINTAAATAAPSSPTTSLPNPTLTKKAPAATAKAGPPASPSALPSITDDNDNDDNNNNKANRPKTPDDDEDNKGKKGDNSKKVSPNPTNTTQESNGPRNPANPPKPTAPEARRD